METQTQRITLHQKQYEAFRSGKRFIGAIGGVQSGKTFLGAVWSGRKITEFPDKNGLICAPTVKILNHSTLEKFFELYPQLRPYYKKQESVIELPEGGKVFVRSTDDPYSIEGMTIHWAWADEAGNMKRSIWPVLKARVSTTKGQVLFTSTPYMQNWFYREFFVPWQKGLDPDIEIFTWPSIANPYADEAFIEAERRRLRSEEFAMRYEGTFTRMSGLVYPTTESMIVEHNEVLKKVIDLPDRVIAGVDWGYENPAAIVIGVVKDAVFYVVDEWKRSKLTTSEIIAQMKTFKDKYQVQLWFPDPAEPDRIEEMKRAGLSVGETSKDVEAGIGRVGSLLRDGKLFIANTCHETLDEFSQYHYPEGEEGREAKEAPVKFNDHLLDALRYLVQGYFPTDPRVIAKRRIDVRNKQLRTSRSFE